MKLTKAQQIAVDSLFERYKNKDQYANNQIPPKTIVDFKAPTGAGKTFMIASLISKILDYNSLNENHKIVFLIATLSNAELPKQFNDKLNEYQQYLDYKYTSQHLESPSKSKDNKSKDYYYKIEPKHQKVIVVGKSSFSKSAIFSEQGIFDNFLHQCINEDYKLIYIRDEAHIGTKTKESKDEYVNRFENNTSNTAYFQINMTATPNKDNINNLVVVDEDDLSVEDEYLIKDQQIFNEGLFEANLQDESYDSINDEQILKTAINKFKEIKKQYQKYKINPALLIQVSDDSEKDELKKQKFQESYTMLINMIKESGLTYCRYFSDQKADEGVFRGKWGSIKEEVNLKTISKKDSAYDVIIFKVGPATGWDIPRACMLVQIRNVSSDQLNIQTVGRIRRNPLAPNLVDPIFRNYYIYSIHDHTIKNFNVYKIKNNFKQQQFPQVVIKNKEVAFVKNNQREIKEEIISILEEAYAKQISDGLNVNFERDKSEIVFKLKDIKTNKEINVKYRSQIAVDAISFELNMIKIIEQHKQINDVLVKIIQDWIDFKIKHKKCELLSRFSFYQIYYVIYEYLWSSIIKVFSTQKQILNKQIQYEVQRVFAKNEFAEIDIDSLDKKQPKQIMINNVFGDKYIYEHFKKNKLNDEGYFLVDSKAEYDFIHKMKNVIKQQDVKGFRNPAKKSDVYLEYLVENENGDTSINKSYFDFVFKVNKKDKDSNLASTEFFLVEIKSADDIDEQKTKLLKEKYQEIASKLQNQEVVICIAQVGQTKSKQTDIDFHFYCSDQRKQQKYNEIEFTKENENPFTIKF